MNLAPIPPHPLPLLAKAPGKCVLFGEHAVVHGRPELLLAIDLYTQVGLAPSTLIRLNGDPAAARENPYLRTALDRLWSGKPPVDVNIVSRLPRAAGLGSSAAFTSALAAGLGAATGGLMRGQLAQAAFSIERRAQGVGSPGDTSASVAGGYLSLNAPGDTALWEVEEDDQQWVARRVDDPGWVWLVGFSGVPRSTAEAVRAFGRKVAEPGGRTMLESFEHVALRGIDAVAAGDREAVGKLLTENHALLKAAGVSHPRLETLLAAVAPAVEGAKLTGAGAGGSIVALPRLGTEMEASRRLARAGGVAFIVRPAPNGTELVGGPTTG